MGVLPLQFADGETAASLGLTGREVFALEGAGAGLKPRVDRHRRGHGGRRLDEELHARWSASTRRKS